MILGLTGKIGAGKGEVARFLQEAGFQYHSLSDILREEIRKQGYEVTRGRLIEMGTRLRRENGLGALAELALKKLASDQNYVVDSIRNPEEVKVLRRRSDFRLIDVTAPRKMRFLRVKARWRENDPTTFKDFVETEEREFKSKDPAAQQLLVTAKMADKILHNEGSLEKLKILVRETALEFTRAFDRPSWDDYFLEIARVVSLRSNCLKRKVAALIVKDRRIIASGYNGTPRGVTNCNEGGCPRCNAFGTSGAGLEDCYCSHAEENAITQSAYHGVNIKDAVLYTTFSPCLMCTKMIINSGIREVVYDAHYPLLDVAKNLFHQADVHLRRANEAPSKISKKTKKSKTSKAARVKK